MYQSPESTAPTSPKAQTAQLTCLCQLSPRLIVHVVFRLPPSFGGRVGGGRQPQGSSSIGLWAVIATSDEEASPDCNRRPDVDFWDSKSHSFMLEQVFLIFGNVIFSHIPAANSHLRGRISLDLHPRSHSNPTPPLSRLQPHHRKLPSDPPGVQSSIRPKALDLKALQLSLGSSGQTPR